MPVVDPTNEPDLQSPCSECMDLSFDISPVETNAVDISLDEHCEFLDLDDQVTISLDECKIQSTGGSHSYETIQRESSNEQLAERSAAAAADIASQMADVCDISEYEDNVEIEPCHISRLSTPKLIIDKRSSCTTPASLFNWNSDVDDTVSLLDYDLFQDDDKVLPDDADLLVQSTSKNLADDSHDVNTEERTDREVHADSLMEDMELQQSEKKHVQKEVDNEHICILSTYTDMEDPDDEDELTTLLSDDEKTDPVDSAEAKVTPKLTSGNPSFGISWQPSQPLWAQQSLDTCSVAAGQTTKLSAEFHSFPTKQSLDYDAECSQSTDQENGPNGNQSKDYHMISTQLASSGKKQKKLPQLTDRSYHQPQNSSKSGR